MSGSSCLIGLTGLEGTGSSCLIGLTGLEGTTGNLPLPFNFFGAIPDDCISRFEDFVRFWAWRINLKFVSE